MASFTVKLYDFRFDVPSDESTTTNEQCALLASGKCVRVVASRRTGTAQSDGSAVSFTAPSYPELRRESVFLTCQFADQVFFGSGVKEKVAVLSVQLSTSALPVVAAASDEVDFDGRPADQPVCCWRHTAEAPKGWRSLEAWIDLAAAVRAVGESAQAAEAALASTHTATLPPCSEVSVPLLEPAVAEKRWDKREEVKSGPGGSRFPEDGVGGKYGAAPRITCKVQLCPAAAVAHEKLLAVLASASPELEKAKASYPVTVAYVAKHIFALQLAVRDTPDATVAAAVESVALQLEPFVKLLNSPSARLSYDRGMHCTVACRTMHDWTECIRRRQPPRPFDKSGGTKARAELDANAPGVAAAAGAGPSAGAAADMVAIAIQAMPKPSSVKLDWVAPSRGAKVGAAAGGGNPSAGELGQVISAAFSRLSDGAVIAAECAGQLPVAGPLVRLCVGIYTLVVGRRELLEAGHDLLRRVGLVVGVLGEPEVREIVLVDENTRALLFMAYAKIEAATQVIESFRELGTVAQVLSGNGRLKELDRHGAAIERLLAQLQQAVSLKGEAAARAFRLHMQDTMVTLHTAVAELSAQQVSLMQELRNDITGPLRFLVKAAADQQKESLEETEEDYREKVERDEEAHWSALLAQSNGGVETNRKTAYGAVLMRRIQAFNRKQYRFAPFFLGELSQDAALQLRHFASQFTPISAATTNIQSGGNSSSSKSEMRAYSSVEQAWNNTRAPLLASEPASQRCRRVLIEAPAGSGKSTVVKWLARSHRTLRVAAAAAAAAAAGAEPTDDAGNKLGPMHRPHLDAVIVVELIRSIPVLEQVDRDYPNLSVTQSADDDPDWIAALLPMMRLSDVEQTVPASEVKLAAAALRAARDRVLVIFDGFDEVQYTACKALRVLMLRIDGPNPHFGNVIVTTRPERLNSFGHSASQKLFTNFQLMRLLPWESGQVRRYVAGFPWPTSATGDESAADRLGPLERMATSDAIGAPASGAFLRDAAAPADDDDGAARATVAGMATTTTTTPPEEDPEPDNPDEPSLASHISRQSIWTIGGAESTATANAAARHVSVMPPDARRALALLDSEAFAAQRGVPLMVHLVCCMVHPATVRVHAAAEGLTEAEAAARLTPARCLDRLIDSLYMWGERRALGLHSKNTVLQSAELEAVRVGAAESRRKSEATLMHQAYLASRTGAVEIPDETFDLLRGSGVLEQVRRPLVPGGPSQYRFLHKSVAEYLSARFIVFHGTMDRQRQKQHFSQPSRLDETVVLSFVADLLADDRCDDRLMRKDRNKVASPSSSKHHADPAANIGSSGGDGATTTAYRNVVPPGRREAIEDALLCALDDRLAPAAATSSQKNKKTPTFDDLRSKLGVDERRQLSRDIGLDAALAFIHALGRPEREHAIANGAKAKNADPIVKAFLKRLPGAHRLCVLRYAPSFVSRSAAASHAWYVPLLLEAGARVGSGYAVRFAVYHGGLMADVNLAGVEALGRGERGRPLLHYLSAYFKFTPTLDDAVRAGNAEAVAVALSRMRRSEANDLKVLSAVAADLHARGLARALSALHRWLASQKAHKIEQPHELELYLRVLAPPTVQLPFMTLAESAEFPRRVKASIEGKWIARDLPDECRFTLISRAFANAAICGVHSVERVGMNGWPEAVTLLIATSANHDEGCLALLPTLREVCSWMRLSRGLALNAFVALLGSEVLDPIDVSLVASSFAGFLNGSTASEVEQLLKDAPDVRDYVAYRVHLALPAIRKIARTAADDGYAVSSPPASPVTFGARASGSSAAAAAAEAGADINPRTLLHAAAQLRVNLDAESAVTLLSAAVGPCFWRLLTWCGRTENPAMAVELLAPWLQATPFETITPVAGESERAKTTSSTSPARPKLRGVVAAMHRFRQSKRRDDDTDGDTDDSGGSDAVHAHTQPAAQRRGADRQRDARGCEANRGQTAPARGRDTAAPAHLRSVDMAAYAGKAFAGGLEGLNATAADRRACEIAGVFARQAVVPIGQLVEAIALAAPSAARPRDAIVLLCAKLAASGDRPACHSILWLAGLVTRPWVSPMAAFPAITDPSTSSSVAATTSTSLAAPSRSPRRGGANDAPNTPGRAEQIAVASVANYMARACTAGTTAHDIPTAVHIVASQQMEPMSIRLSLTPAEAKRTLATFAERAAAIGSPCVDAVGDSAGALLLRALVTCCRGERGKESVWGHPAIITAAAETQLIAVETAKASRPPPPSSSSSAVSAEPPQVAAAYQWLKGAAEKGCTQAQFLYGRRLFEQAQAAKSKAGGGDDARLAATLGAAAVGHLRRAATVWHAGAQYLLGRCYELGIGGTGETDLDAAIAWYRLAGLQHHPVALYRHAQCVMSPAGRVAAVSDNNNTHDGGEAGPALAVHLLRRSAALNHSPAQSRLAMCYAEGAGVSRDRDRATLWATRAAEKGDVDAQYALGKGTVRTKHGGKRSAAAYLQHAADAMHLPSIELLAERRLTGHPGIPKDVVAAFQGFKLAVERGGSADAQLQLGLCHLKGLGVAKADPETARSHFRAAAQRGSPAGAFQFARALIAAHQREQQQQQSQPQQASPLPSSEEDPAAAAKKPSGGRPKALGEAEYWLRSACALGYAPAQHQLALLLVDAQMPSDTDRREAVLLLQGSAEAGYAPAQSALGAAYLDGVYGIAKAPNKAAKLLRAAANANDADGCFGLYRCYLNGLGVAANAGEAKRWLDKAAALNHRVAIAKGGSIAPEAEKPPVSPRRTQGGGGGGSRK